MPRVVAFLRGINLGNRRPKMDELRAPFEELGLENVATYLASGNVIFDHPGQDLPELEAGIQAHLENALGFSSETFLRPLADLALIPELEVVRAALDRDFNCHVIFLRDPPGGDVQEELNALETPDDRFHVLDREVLWLRRGRTSDSSVGPRDLETALGGPENTMRNLNTVRRLVKKFGA